MFLLHFAFFNNFLFNGLKEKQKHDNQFFEWKKFVLPFFLHIFFLSLKMLVLMLFNRPCVAGAVLQSPLSLTDKLIQRSFS